VDGEDEGYAQRANAAHRMTDSEAAELATLAQAGDPYALAALVVSHRRIVAKLARQYARGGLPTAERVRLGEEGLQLAVGKFDAEKGFRFFTYATWWVRQAIMMGPGGEDGGGAVREPRSPQPSSDAGWTAH
jgi:RNA polymerase primary sigma factor